MHEHGREHHVELFILEVHRGRIHLPEIHRHAHRFRPGMGVTQHRCCNIDCRYLRVGIRLSPRQGVVADRAATIENGGWRKLGEFQSQVVG